MHLLACMLLLTDLSFSAEILFTAFGDYGRTGSTLDAVVSTLNSQPKARFSVLLGDLAYPDGFKHVGDEHFGIFESFAKSADAFYVVLGNHDYRGSIDAIKDYAAENSKFVFPTSKRTYHAKKLKLTKGYGLCMLFIDTMHLEPAHVEWMHEVLGQCGGKKYFRLIFGHYPIFSVGMYADDASTKRTRSIMEPILDKYGAHAYISGHEHHMEAFESKGRHYIISGAVAELNRNGPIQENEHQDIVKFAYRKGPAFANFRFIEDSGRIEYSFVDAADDGNVLYKASIKVGDAVYIGDEEVAEKPSVSPAKRKEPCVTSTDAPAVGKDEKDKNVKGKPKPVKEKGLRTVCEDEPENDDDGWDELYLDDTPRNDISKSDDLVEMKLLVAVIALFTVI
jgi:tartrate-resistant acid phosphatase type 5